jgi:hypothetical protein
VICLCLGATILHPVAATAWQVHRILGRCYVIGVVVAATISSRTMLRNELPLQ